MRRNFSALVILIASALLIAGCAGRESNREESVAQPAGTGNTQPVLSAESGNNTDIPVSSAMSPEDIPDIDSEKLLDFPLEEMSGDEINALNRAMDNEYKLRATYQKALDTFGEVKPFADIFSSTERHVEALTILFDKYGLEFPRDEWFELIPEFDTVHAAYEACQVMEMESAAFYDDLLGKIDNEDIRFVFTEFRRVSTEKNVPEFQRYIEGRTG